MDFDDVDIDTEFLDELSDHIDQEHLYYLQNQIYEINTEELREKLKDQVGDPEDIFAQITRDMIYDQEVEISPRLSAHFRTIPSKAQDSAMAYAREHAETQNEYNRVLARRRLAYTLVSQNGQQVSEPLDKSLYDIAQQGADPLEVLNEFADSAMTILDTMPDNLVTRLSQSFGVWENMVTDRIKESDHAEIAKN